MISDEEIEKKIDHTYGEILSRELIPSGMCKTSLIMAFKIGWMESKIDSEEKLVDRIKDILDSPNMDKGEDFNG